MDGLSDDSGSVKCWMYWSSRSAFLHRNVATSVDMLFTCCTEVDAYACRLALAVQNNSGSANNAPLVHCFSMTVSRVPSLHYISWPSSSNGKPSFSWRSGLELGSARHCLLLGTACIFQKFRRELVGKFWNVCCLHGTTIGEAACQLCIRLSSLQNTPL